MRLPVSKKEKKLLKELIKSDRNTYGLIDFLSGDWPGGKLEVSTFMQTLNLQVTDDQLPQVMHHLVDRLNFVKALEKEGYINLWSELPVADNTTSLGDASGDAKTIFVPDITIATELLKYANYHISFSDSLREWSKKNFRSRGHFPLVKGAVYVLIILLVADLIYHAQGIRASIDLDHQQIVEKNKEVLENQLLSNQIIDSLRSQNRDLIQTTDQISSNTRNMKDIEGLIRKQQNAVNEMQMQLNQLHQQLKASRKSSQKTDSLISQLIKTES